MSGSVYGSLDMGYEGQIIDLHEQSTLSFAIE
jgi:hypothetical protein